MAIHVVYLDTNYPSSTAPHTTHTTNPRTRPNRHSSPTHTTLSTCQSPCIPPPSLLLLRTLTLVIPRLPSELTKVF
ncbi:hypothetical protein EON65_52925 [archaeon]|nr:MAG: hypothetical protein EON65_52925 [archaeon]